MDLSDPSDLQEKLQKLINLVRAYRQALLSSSSIPVHEVMESQGQGKWYKKKPVQRTGIKKD